MDAFEIHEILQRQAKTGIKYKSPVNQNIDLQKKGPELNPISGEPPALNKTGRSIPWEKILLAAGLVALLVYLRYLYLKNKNHQSISERNQERSSG